MNFTGCWRSATGNTQIFTNSPSVLIRHVVSRQSRIIFNGHCFATDQQAAQVSDVIARTNEIGAANRWPGCYSFMLITRSKVTLLTDPIGQFPLFVAERADDVWFGTNSADVAKHAGSLLDRVSLTAALGCPETNELTSGRSLYHEVRRIPMGRVVSIGQQGVRERED